MAEKIIFTILGPTITDPFDKAIKLQNNLKEIVYEMGLHNIIDIVIQEIHNKSKFSDIVFVINQVASLSSQHKNALNQSRFNIFLDVAVFDSYIRSGFTIDYSRDLNLGCYDSEGLFKLESLQKLVSCLIK